MRIKINFSNFIKTIELRTLFMNKINIILVINTLARIIKVINFIIIILSTPLTSLD